MNKLLKTDDTDKHVMMFVEKHIYKLEPWQYALGYKTSLKTLVFQL